MTKKRPYQAQGMALKTAREARDLRIGAVATKLDLKTPQVYRNWEKGLNRPDPNSWVELGALLGIDISALYTGKGAGGATPHAIDPAALRPLIARIRANLETLESLVGTAATDTKLEKQGFIKMGGKAKAG